MKPSELDALIDDCLEGCLTDADAAALNRSIEQSAEARARYWEAASIHGLLEHTMQQATLRAVTGQAPLLHSKKSRWPQWRPLTAAAAGLVLGLFCASAAWAVVGSRLSGQRVNEVLLDESFESMGEMWNEGFPARAGIWGGEQGKIVPAKEELHPIDGDHMARLDPAMETTLSYLDHVIDLRGYPLPEAGEVRQIEVTASFHADTPGIQERYTLRVATFGEAPEQIQTRWVDVPWPEMSDRALSLSKRGLSTSADADGWQTLSVIVEVPSEATSAVISLAAGRLDPAAPKSPHYLDDVSARLLVTPRTAHPRNRRR